MADVVHGAQQDFWRPPSILDPAAEAAVPSPENQQMAEACAGCGSEFLIGAKFCHACGLRRPLMIEQLHTDRADAAVVAGLWVKAIARARAGFSWVAASWGKVPFPAWLHYLHFHEIKRWVGLPTAALIAFMVGLGCVIGAIGVSLFYKASNLAEFQAIQLWRIEWLLAATASFVAGILLKKPYDRE